MKGDDGAIDPEAVVFVLVCSITSIGLRDRHALQEHWGIDVADGHWLKAQLLSKFGNCHKFACAVGQLNIKRVSGSGPS